MKKLEIKTGKLYDMYVGFLSNNIVKLEFSRRGALLYAVILKRLKQSCPNIFQRDRN